MAGSPDHLRTMQGLRGYNLWKAIPDICAGKAFRQNSLRKLLSGNQKGPLIFLNSLLIRISSIMIERSARIQSIVEVM
jgi:hypothetical protein